MRACCESYSLSTICCGRITRGLRIPSTRPIMRLGLTGDYSIARIQSEAYPTTSCIPFLYEYKCVCRFGAFL